MFTSGKDYYTTADYARRLAWWFVYWICFRYSPRLLYGWRNGWLRLMGATIGSHVRIFPSVKITFPWKLTVGDHSIISWDVTLYNLGSIYIGRGTIVSQGAHLCAGTHDYRAAAFTLRMAPIVIGDGVWIAADAFIGPGVHVENEALVGARAVVVKNVSINQMVAGNPARPIGNRYDA